MLAILIVLTLLIALNGFFVVAEFAVARLRKTGGTGDSQPPSDSNGQKANSLKANGLAEQGADHPAVESTNLNSAEKQAAGLMERLTAPIVKDPTAFLAATQLGITASSLAIGWIAADLLVTLGQYFANESQLGAMLRDGSLVQLLIFLVIFGGLTLLHSLFAEIIPKTLAYHRPALALKLSAGPLRLFALIAWPAVRLVDFLADLLLRLFGMRRIQHGERHSTSDLLNIVEQSRRSGEIDPTSHELITKVFAFRHRTVKQIMVARPQIAALEVTSSTSEIMRKCIEEGYSRVPVYEGSLDNILGVVYAKDLLSMVEHNNLIILQDLMRPPFFVAEHKGISELLREFQQQRLHLAIVIDEFGGTAGLVTMEDIIEELVGEIQDEFDKEEPMVQETAAGEFTVNAAAAIADANRLLPTPLPEGEQYDTVGGFVNVLFEKIPDLHETRQFADYELTVAAKDRRTIQSVYLRYLPTAGKSTQSTPS